MTEQASPLHRSGARGQAATSGRMVDCIWLTAASSRSAAEI
jgi:hypothetical protein